MAVPVRRCADLIANGYAMCTDAQYAGYCDRDCGTGQCTGCANFAEGAAGYCQCSSFGGVHNCPNTCNGFCAADKSHTARPAEIRVDGNTPHSVLGSIDADCPANFGRHEWFHFHAEAGRMYQIYTEILPDGLEGTYLHLHSLDADSTPLADGKAWHCPTTGPGNPHDFGKMTRQAPGPTASKPARQGLFPSALLLARPDSNAAVRFLAGLQARAASCGCALRADGLGRARTVSEFSRFWAPAATGLRSSRPTR